MLVWLAATASAVPLTPAEVARHDQREDCWLVIDDVVYDATDWIESHPGGSAITRGCGKDATWFFTHRDGAEQDHSAAAREILEGMRLGEVGADVDIGTGTVESPHPYDLRLEGAWAGPGPSTGVGPRNSITLRVAHAISTVSDVPTGIATQLGYSFGFLDVLVSDEQGVGLGSLEVKVRPLHQHADRPMPLSVAVVGGAGMAYGQDVPAVYGQLVLERDLIDRRLVFRLDATGGIAPGTADSAALSFGGSAELRPIPIHGLFGSVRTPTAEPGNLDWAAGARFYTRLHAFALYVSNTPALSPWAQASPTPQSIAIGGNFERAFLLRRKN